MPTLVFDAATMSTGAQSVDDQHKELIRLLNSLMDAMSTGQGRTEIGSIIDGLARYATTHFSHEEGCMARFNCPILAANKAAHAEFIRTFGAIKAEFDRTGPSAAIAIRVQRELSDWIAKHIKAIDVQLKPCIPPGTRA